MSGDELAAVIDRKMADEVIPLLKEADTYDGTRKIESLDNEELAIPVTEAAAIRGIDRFEAGLATQRRLRTLEDYLRVDGWSETELQDVPKSYARLGDLIVITDTLPEEATTVGEALLDLHRDAVAVIQIDSIIGDHRHPSITHIAGETTTQTVHNEHGLQYAFDLEEVMFSPGNQHERIRMGSVVSADERVVDLCAGIGYFTISMADSGADVVAIEHNPRSFRWLTKNMSLNGLDDRITPVQADCRDVSVTADRAVIGHLPVHDCRDDPTDFGGGYLDSAVNAVAEGWLHVHGIAWSNDHQAARDRLYHRLEQRGVEVTECTLRRIKGIAENTDHIVIDVHIGESV